MNKHDIHMVMDHGIRSSDTKKTGVIWLMAL